jgi:hypothetical protein
MITLAKKLRHQKRFLLTVSSEPKLATSYDLIDLHAQASVQFLDFNSLTRLAEGDSVIIPQGVVEQIETRSNSFGEKIFVLQITEAKRYS